MIVQPRGLPADLSAELREEYDGYNDHTPSWLTLKELLHYDHSREFNDMRVTRCESSGITNGAARAFPGEENQVTLREFLGKAFFDDVRELAVFAAGRPLRVVFWFGN